MEWLGAGIRPVTLAVGEEVGVELTGAPGGGYVWSLTVSGAALGPAREQVSVAPGVGGSGSSTFVMKALAPGSATVVARLKRPWEDRAVEERRWSLRVEAAAPDAQE